MKKKGSSKRERSDQASAVREVVRLEDIPNVGPSIAADLRQLGITTPAELPGA
jgi:predicted flap endonuclease-1-like 5' DNA nuclease